MAFQLSSIGAAGASIGRALPAALRGVHGLGKGLEFAGQLDLNLQDASAQGSVLAQIASTIRAGTPLASIANHIAANLSAAVVSAAGSTGNTTAQSTLQRALASALAPPGKSPPANSGTVQAALLQQRLTDVVTKLTEEATSAGQQSEFSGTVLDANSAKETPAQQGKNPTDGAQGTPAAIASLVQSLLSASALAAADQAVASGAASAPTGTRQAPTQSQSAEQQPAVLADILTRILTRAANADAQRSGQSAGRTPVSVPAPSGATSNGNANPAVLFERLIAAIAQQQADSQANTDGGKDRSPDGASAPASFAAQAAIAPASVEQTPAQPQSLPYVCVDPQAVIEQIVKGIAMRNSGSTSEMNLRLQPEHLGDVSLRLTVTGNTITANVVAQNADVRDMLLGNQQQLARSLAEAGLSLGKFSVNVSGGNAGFTQQQSQQQAGLGKSISVGGSLLSNENGTWEDQRFGPSLAGGSGSLVFNYLA